MNLFNLSIILLILIPLAYYLIHDYMKGLCIATFLLISLSSYLVIETPGSFPNFTIHRLILILLFIVWGTKNKATWEFGKIPFFSLLVSIGIINFISLIISPVFSYSLKAYLSFTVEIILFYIIMITSLNDKEDAFRMLKYICFALTTVAIFAVIERYTGFNPIDSYLPGYVRKAKYANDVMSTYPHRILLGTAMAMGWPIALALADNIKRNKFIYWISTVLLISSCYFAYSRGPWLASIISGVVIFILGSSGIRKKCIIIIVLVLAAFIIRPGVWDTIKNLAVATTDPYSLKGSSYQWRWELWRKAYSEVNKSTERILFGYGPGTSESLDWEGVVSFWDGNVIDDFWSWDNHYAATLLEGGFVGLGVVIILYISISKRLYNTWAEIDKSHKNIVAGIIASVTVLIFMKMNVKIFAPQLNYLFWSLVSIGVIIGPEVYFQQFIESDGKK